MTGRRLLAGIVILAVVATASGGAVGEAAKKRPPSQAAVAKRLAARVAAARTDGARYRAVLEVMRTLFVRVHSSQGKVLAKGARDLPRGFHLYDVELHAIAAALARGDRTTLAELSSRLAELGIVDRGEPIATETLRQVLVDGVRRSAAAPRRRTSVVPLLVRELGLRQRPAVDLLRAPTAPELRFDALQSFLILADIALPLAKRLGVSGAGGLRTLQAANAPCSSQAMIAVAESMPFLQWSVGLIDKFSGPLTAINIQLATFHGTLLAYSVRVEARSPELQQTHYGPAEHGGTASGGQELRFRVLVRMLDDLPEVLIRCGPLVGLKFPEQGPIPGIPVLWEQAEQRLDKHGTITYDPPDQRTGSDGIASLVFTPKDEQPIVGFGLEKSKRGVVNGVALYQSALGNVPGAVAQFLTPKYAGFAWEVFFHKPRGFKFEGLKFRVVFGEFGDVLRETDIDVSGRVCGDDAYAAPWEIRERHFERVRLWGDNGELVVDETKTFESAFPLDLEPGRTDVTTSSYWFEPGPPPRLTAEYRAGPFEQPPTQTASVAVEEAASCPEND